MDKQEIKQMLGIPKAAVLAQVVLLLFIVLFGFCLVTANAFTVFALVAVGLCAVGCAVVSIKSGNWVLVLMDVLACGICVYIYFVFTKLAEGLL